MVVQAELVYMEAMTSPLACGHDGRRRISWAFALCRPASTGCRSDQFSGFSSPWPTASRTRASELPLETCHNVKRLAALEDLAARLPRKRCNRRVDDIDLPGL
jgi:hypothetical protein